MAFKVSGSAVACGEPLGGDEAFHCILYLPTFEHHRKHDIVSLYTIIASFPFAILLAIGNE